MQARIGTGIGLVQLLAQALAQTLRRGVAALAQLWRRLIGKPYRPEKHYMRGPGPKWRAKYAAAEDQRSTRGEGRLHQVQDAAHSG
jgi:hypothetical protein